MNNMNHHAAEKKVALAIGLIFILIIGFVLSYTLHVRKIEGIQENKTPPQEQKQVIPDVPYQATLEGTYVCLPHKNTEGPQTLECAFGIKADDGQYYALSTNLLEKYEDIYEVKVGDRLKVDGILVPIEQLSTDRWQVYNIRGIIDASRIEVLYSS